MWYIAFLSLCFAVQQSRGTVFPTPFGGQEKGISYWINKGRVELDEAINRLYINKTAKNVIIFIGDGMGPPVTTAGRIFKGQRKKGFSGEEEDLSWERFPHSAMIKTYNLDRQVADSAASATAFFGGVKGNYYTLGVGGRVAVNECYASLQRENQVNSVLQWAQLAGKDTGFVTTTRVTHATPAALYAHSANRRWECDAKMKNESFEIRRCKDIARQLAENVPGRYINVIFAGGRRQMGAALPDDLEGDTSCLREDNRNLVEYWLQDKRDRLASAKYVYSIDTLNDVDLTNTEYIIGLFAAGHLPYEYDRIRDPRNTAPSLKDMTLAALKRLQMNKEDGYFLMVEGGRIDHALHDTKPRLAMEEMLAFDEAVEATMKVIDVKDTLVIVTADHSHAMTINGYPVRGNDILGKTTYEHVTDGMPYTTIIFTNGVGTNFTYNGTTVVRANVTDIDTTDRDYISQAAVPTEEGYETHGGEDVALFAIGPMAHLFHRLHDQSYIAHVMGYAACIGPFRDGCPKDSEDSDGEDDTGEPCCSSPLQSSLVVIASAIIGRLYL